MASILIGTATYNESENIGALLHEIVSLVPNARLIVVDDSSPDGTGKLLEELKKSTPQLEVIHRPEKLGVGSAHMLIVKHAIEHNFDFLLTLDSDFSHAPRYLPLFITQLNQGAEFVIGSRYTAGGNCDYGIFRQILSRGANLLATILLNIPLKESTTSYRGFATPLLKQLNLEAISSTGYSFFLEFTYEVTQRSDRLAEIPIHFEERHGGVSKISRKEIIKGIFNLFRLTVLHWKKQLFGH